MGGLRQLGRLFWKNYVVRKRQPWVLALEVLWPLIIFVIVVVIRQGTPPTNSDTCKLSSARTYKEINTLGLMCLYTGTYPERSLPSAGLVNFLQSSVCSLGNDCNTAAKQVERATAQQRLSSLLEEIDPILQKDTTQAVLQDALPKMDKLITALKNSSTSANLTAIEEKLKLRNMFKDPDEVVNIAVYKYQLMSEQTAQELLDSKINVGVLLKNFGLLDFKAIVCSPRQLSSYVIFRVGTDVNQVSNSLCNIGEDSISDVTSALISQLDLANIIRIGEDFASYTGQFDLAALLNDMAQMVDLLNRSPNVMAALGDIDLSSLPELFNTLGGIVPQLERMENIDLEGLSSMVDFIRPLLPADDGMTELLDSVDQAFSGAGDFLNAMQGEELDLEKLYEQMAPLLNELNSLMNDSSLQFLQQIPREDFSMIMEMISGNMSTDVGDLSLNRSLDSMQETLEMLFNVSTVQQIMMVADEAIMMTKDVFLFQQVFEQNMQSYLNSPAAQQAMVGLMTLGPEKAGAFLGYLVQPTNLQRVISGVDGSIKTICTESVEAVLRDIDGTSADAVKTNLCSDSVTSGLQYMLSNGNYEALTRQMEMGIMKIDDILQGHGNGSRVFLRDLYAKEIELVNLMSSVLSLTGWHDVVGSWLEQTPGLVYNEEWEMMWGNVSMEYLRSFTIVDIQMIGPMLENTTMWSTVGPMIHSADVMMEYMIKQQEATKAMSDSSSVMGQMMSYVEYLPDVMAAMMMDTNGGNNRFSELLQTDGIDVVVCKDHYLQSLNLSSEVPVTDMEDFLCTTNWTDFGMDMLSLYDMTPAINEMISLMNSTRAYDSYDWSRVEELADMTSKLFENPQQFLTTGPWEIAMNEINFTKLGEKLGEMMSSMQFMQVDDAVSYSQMAVAIMEQLDASLQDVPYWIYAKHYMNAWMAYTKVLNQYLVDSQGANFTLTEYVKQMSPTLGEYLEQSTDIVPDLFAAITDMTRQPHLYIPRVLMYDWDQLCNGSSLIQQLGIKSTANTTAFEEGLCKLNWTAINMEVLENDPNLAQYYQELDVIMSTNLTSLPDIHVNWTELTQVSEEYMKLLGNISTLQSIPDLPGLNLDAIATSWDGLFSTLNMTNLEQLSRIGPVSNELLALLDMFEDSGNDSMSLMMMFNNMIMSSYYIQYEVIVFLNKQLEYFNSTDVIDLKKYFNSTEMDKVFRASDLNAELNAAMLDNLLDALENSTKMAALFTTNLTEACIDPQVFSKVFSVPDNANITMADLHGAVCGLNLNITHLLMELSHSLDGFGDMLQNLMILNQNMTSNRQLAVNSTLWMMENDRTSKLIESLIMNPPNITMTFPVDNLQSQYEEVFSRISGSFTNTTELMKLFAVLQQQAGAAMPALQPESTELHIMLVANYFIERFDQTLRSENGSVVDFTTVFRDLPEMMALWNLMDHLPELYLTYTYTSLNHQEKVTTFTEALVQGVEVLCTKDPDSLMTVPPGVDFDFVAFFNNFCSVNLSLVEQEFYQITGLGPEYMDFLQQLPNMTAADLQDFSANSDRLSQTITELFNDSMTLPRFLDSGVWNSTLHTLGNLLANFTQTPAGNQDLMDWLDFNRTMDAIGQLAQNPDILLSISSMIGPSFESLPPSIPLGTLNVITDMVLLMLDKLPVENTTLEALLSDPNKLTEMADMLNDLEMQMSLFYEALHTNQMERAGMSVALQLAVCNRTVLDMYAGYMMNFTLDLDAVQTSLCGQGYDLWYINLRNNGFSEMDISSLLIMFNVIDPMANLESLNWNDLVTSVQHVLEKLDTIPVGNLTNAVEDLFQWLEQYSENLSENNIQSLGELIDLADTNDTEIMSIQQLLALTVSAQDYLLQRLKILSDSGWTVPVSSLLPDAEYVSRILENAIGQQSTAAFLLASMNPEKFLSLSLSNQWTEVMCDPTEFSATFQFPEGVDVVALQQDLCGYAQREAAAISELMNSINAQGLMAQIEALMTGQSNTTLNLTEIMTQLNTNTQQLLGYLEGLMTYSNWGVDTWLEPVASAAGSSVSTMSRESLIATCESTLQYIRGTDMFYEQIQLTLNSVTVTMAITNNYVHIFKAVTEVMCDMKDQSLKDVITRLNQTSVPQNLEMIIRAYTGDQADLEFTCPRMVDFNTELSNSINATIISLVEMDNMEECIMESFDTVMYLLQNMSVLMEISNEMGMLLQDEGLRNLTQGMMGNDDFLSLADLVLRSFNQQEQYVGDLEEIIQRNMSSVSQLLQDTASLTPDAITTLLNETLRLDRNITASQLLSILCDPAQLQSALDVPGTIVNITDLAINSSLCGKDREMAIMIADNLIQLADLTNDLQNIEEFDFWADLSEKVAELVSDIEGISYISEILDDIQNIDLNDFSKNSELLDRLQRILVDSGPDDLIGSFNAVLQSFEGVLGNDSAAIFAEVEVLTQGLLSFNTFRNLLVSSFRIEGFLKDSEELKRIMVSDFMIPPAVMDAILDGSITFEILLQAANKNLTDWVCDSSQLSELLTNPELDADVVSHAFCNLDTDIIAMLVNDMLGQLDIGDLLKELVTSGLSSALDSSGVTLEETEEALLAITAADEDLKAVFEEFTFFTEDLEDVVTTLALGQTGVVDLPSVAGLLCGATEAQIRDEFSLVPITLGSSVPEQTQEEEIKELPEGFCQDMYKEIMQTTEGAVIWGFMKPLVRGKILVSPDTPEIRMIVKKLNATFETVSETLEIAQSWAAGTRVLESVLSQEIQDILKNPVIEGLLTQLAGVSLDSLFDPLYSVNNTNSNLVKGLSNAAQMLSDYIGCIESDRFEFFPSESELEQKAKELGDKNNLLAGIVFTNILPQNRKKRQAVSGLPKHVQYKIRMDIDNVMHTSRLKHLIWRNIPEDAFADNMRYFRGFVQLQDLLDRAIISVQTGRDNAYPKVMTKQFPFPCHKDDAYLNALGAYLMPVLMTFAWITCLAVAVNNLVFDRENGQEETLKAMGMVSALNWWAWFLTSMLIMAAVSIVAVVILHYGGLFANSNVGILFLYFITFCFSALTMSYFVSSFFTQTSLAILASLIVYLISYLPYIVLMSTGTKMTFWQKALACLSSTSAFGFSAEYLTIFEEQRIGIQWDNIKMTPVRDDEFSFSFSCIMMLIDGCIYLVLGWYVRNVKPGKYGVAEPWYFPVCPFYWGCSDGSSGKHSEPQYTDLMEVSNTDAPVAISVRGLTKKYGSKTVVDNVSMDIHAGQITALLGYNGAAKSTTMNMLFGLLAPTKGHVRIFNRPQRKMKQDIGVCPQHNALYYYMTVKEHMEFFLAIKGHSHNRSGPEDIKQLLKDLDMWHLRYSRVGELSGGMQRRLCVALAFVGGSRAIVLDEPTSGVDPNGRRSIWNLIIRRKSESAILLSTHHLDEADVLGDRVTIMHNGKLLCSGSPLFLKQNLTSGHRLIVVVDKMTEPDPTAILTRLRRYVEGSKLMEIVGNEMTFTLPANEHPQFAALFEDLENSLSELRIASFGVSDPTLEEAFLKICMASDGGRQISLQSVIQEDVSEKLKNGSSADGNEYAEIKHSAVEMESMAFKQRVSGSSWTMQQISGLIIKRFHHCRRDWRMFISVILFPVLMFLAGLGFYSLKAPDSAPSLILSPAMYGPNTYAFVKDTSLNPFSDKIIDTFKTSPGIGTSCMKGHENLGTPFQCISGQSSFSQPKYEYRNNATCRCEDYRYTCDEGAAGVPPREMITTTTEIVQDLESRDVNTYLLESFHSFIEKRYGGWSFKGGASNDPQDLHTTVWFNNKGHHALPSFYNALSNAVLRASVDRSTHGNPAEFGITAYNHPLLLSKEQLSRETLVQETADIGVVLMILVAFTFIPVGMVVYLVNENLKKEKQLQFVSGVSPTVYWLTSILWDMFVYCIPVALAVAIVAIFKFDVFWARDNLPAMIVVLLLYGWASLPLNYCTVKLFRQPSSAYFTMFCILNFIGIITIAILFALNFYSHLPNLNEAYDICRRVFLIFPPYCLAGALVEMTTNQVQTNIMARFSIDSYVNPFSLDMLGWHMIALAIQGLVFFILAIIIDVAGPCSCASSYTADTESVQDEDVVKEKHNVVLETRRSRGGALMVSNLSKAYRRDGRSFLAVDHLNFMVSHGECFGLLGVNGAGKTTTFKMLTGDIKPNDGDVYIKGKLVKHGSKTLGQQLGYCPQAEALDSFLSVEEMLHCYGRLRGLPASQRTLAVNDVIERLDLDKIRGKTIKACSGGMRRKVSLAVALLGDPELVLLDEPTAGMDPGTRRKAWKALQSAKQKGQAVVLTSHSMSECDVLCSRLSIMVNGQMKCLGSPQHLKDRFGDGFTVTMFITGLSTMKNNILELIHTYFPSASIRDHHRNVVQLDIPRESTRVSTIFRVLEEQKERYNVRYYTVSQTTLDTIFLNFAQDQTDGTNVANYDMESSSYDSSSETNLTSANVGSSKYAYMNPSYADSGSYRKDKPTDQVLQNPEYFLYGKDHSVRM